MCKVYNPLFSVTGAIPCFALLVVVVAPRINVKCGLVPMYVQLWGETYGVLLRKQIRSIYGRDEHLLRMHHLYLSASLTHEQLKPV